MSFKGSLDLDLAATSHPPIVVEGFNKVSVPGAEVSLSVYKYITLILLCYYLRLCYYYVAIEYKEMLVGMNIPRPFVNVVLVMFYIPLSVIFTTRKVLRAIIFYVLFTSYLNGAQHQPSRSAAVTVVREEEIIEDQRLEEVNVV